VPADALEMYREAAAAEAAAPTGGFKITLHFPSYMPVVSYAHDRELRQSLYRAYVTRASEFGKADWDNTTMLLETLRLRREQAQLLGYADYAELSLVPKMAQSPGEVMGFLRDLARRARPHAERDMAELREFAARELGLPELAPWDIAYASEKLREARYAYSEQELKQYFPEPRVIAGLFNVIESLFGVRIVTDRAPLWHAQASFYRIDNARGERIGEFYLDLYAREHKQGGAWQDDARARRRPASGDLQTPVSFLTCNFSRPVGGKPALFTHDEVLTLFHEFGHGLHHLLTRVDVPSVAGINGVPWDAVELPSQFMENFAWRDEVLPLVSAHVETGEALPHDMLARLQASRTFQAGMQTVRQLEFALFDFCLHAEYRPDRPPRIAETLAEVREAVSVVRPPEFNRFPHSFQHVFSGGYAAGYYSYKWAEVLSADAFGAFEEHGVFDAATARRFLSAILERGGSRDAMEAFVEFRGRKPEIGPLLRQMGLAA